MNCWNCGARLNGPTCQMCGAAQAPQPAPPAAPGGPTGQREARRASMPARPPSGASPYAPEWRSEDGPDGQPGMSAYAQRNPYQPSGMPGSGVYQQPPRSGYAMPGARSYVPGGQPQDVPPVPLWEPQPMAPASAPAIEAPSGWAETLAMPLALLCGLAFGVIGAALWGFLVDSTQHNFSYLAFVLGIIVGLGVALGARGYHDIGLSLFAGGLSFLVFFLAMYFRLSLEYSHVIGEQASLFALSFDNYINLVGNYMTEVPINFLNLVLVPLAAMGTAYRYISRGRR